MERPGSDPQPAAEGIIQIRGFGRKYGDLWAVKRLNLSVKRGEIFGFIGPNGAGKTTTIRFLATLLDPTCGTATINGYDVVRQVRDVRRSIGYMPDSFGVYNGMRVWEFLDFFALAYGVKKSHRERLIHDVLALVDLYEKRDDFVDALSRGMRQRLCLAKTLVHDPPVLILDEPASGLDPRARIELKEFLKELRSLGKTIFISSHILSELADVCDSVGILEQGNLLAAGRIADLLRSFQGRRVVRISTLGDAAGAERFLARCPKVEGLTVENHTIRFEFGGTEEELARLWEEMIGQRHRILWIEEQRPSLEELFLRVTRGKVQ